MALQWLTLIASIWLQSINGTNTNFPAYSSELKRLLSLSQIELNNLAFASDAGKLLGWISGLASAHLPLWLVLLIGSSIGLVGYGFQYLFLTSQIAYLSYTQIFFLTVLAGNSICWINTVCYTIAIRNFPLDRQIAVGLSTSYVGLSAKIYTDVVDVKQTQSLADRAKEFLLVNSVLPLLVCLISAPLARDVESRNCKRLTGGFCAMLVITVAMGLFAVITSLRSIVSRFLSPMMILIGMVVFLLLPLVIPFVEKIKEECQQKCLIRVHDEGCVSSMENGEKLDAESGSDYSLELTQGIQEVGPMLMLRKLEFWLYYFVYLFGATLGLVFLNNLGQIAESRGSSQITSLVSLASAFSFFGRLSPSLLDHFLSKNNSKVTRAAIIGAMMAPMCGAFFLLIHGGEIALYISTAIIGTCTGAISSISVSATTELFGTKNFGVNHNILVSNIPIGSFLFGTFAALLYKGERISGEENCSGVQCYQTTFIIWGCLCVFGTLLAYALHRRTKKLCSRN